MNIINSTKYKLLNGSALLKKDLDKFIMNILLTSPKRNGDPWTLLNFTINGCDFLEQAYRKRKLFPYAIIADVRKTNPDYPLKCPFRKVIKICYSFYLEIY